MTGAIQPYQLLEFHRWRQQKLIEVLRSMPADQLWKHLSGSFGSIIELVVHLAWAEKVWYSRIQGDNISSPEPGDLEDVVLRWEAVTQKWAELIETEADFERRISYRTSGSGEFHNSIIEILYHLTDHATYHTAQIMNAVRALGGKPVSTNYIHFLREQQIISK